MTENQNMGEWTVRPSSSSRSTPPAPEETPSAARHPSTSADIEDPVGGVNEAGLAPEAAVTGSLTPSWSEPSSDPLTSANDEGSDGPRSRRRAAIGVAILVLVAGAGIGYGLAVVNNDRSGEAETEAEAETVTSGSDDARDEPATPTTSSDQDDSSTSRPNELVVTPLPSMPVAATGLVTGDGIELEGVLPANPAPDWRPQVDELADALGLTVVDSTEPAGRPAPDAQLTLVYPGAMVFEESDSNQFDQTFTGSPEELLGVLAAVLNRGSADLTITGYSDPLDPDAASLASARAEYVVDLLVDLAVTPDQLRVETRESVSAVPDAQTGAVVHRRLDLQIVFGR